MAKKTRSRVKKGDVISKAKGQNTGPARIGATGQVLSDLTGDQAKKAVKDGKARWVTAAGKRMLIKTKS